MMRRRETDRRARSATGSDPSPFPRTAMARDIVFPVSAESGRIAATALAFLAF